MNGTWVFFFLPNCWALYSFIFGSQATTRALILPFWLKIYLRSWVHFSRIIFQYNILHLTLHDLGKEICHHYSHQALLYPWNIPKSRELLLLEKVMSSWFVFRFDGCLLSPVDLHAKFLHSLKSLAGNSVFIYSLVFSFMVMSSLIYLSRIYLLSNLLTKASNSW